MPSRRDTPPPTSAISAGAMLRQRREALGFEVAQVAAVLRIKPAFLTALEEGHPDRLPGPAYAAGFLRVYAQSLGLDGAEVLQRFRREADGLDAKPDLSFPAALGERSMPGRMLLLAALVLAICGYGAWYYLSTGAYWRPERVGKVPASLLRPTIAIPPTKSAATHRSPAAPASDPVVPAAAAPLRPAAQSDAVIRNRAPSRPTPASPKRTEPVRLGDSAPKPAASAEPPSAPVAAVISTGSEGTPREIVIRATARSWIEVRDGGNTVLIEEVLKPGDSYRVPNRPGLTLWTGNAGGLAVTVGGKPAPSLGRSGAVRRNISLEPDALMAGVAIRQ